MKKLVLLCSVVFAVSFSKANVVAKNETITVQVSTKKTIDVTLNNGKTIKVNLSKTKTKNSWRAEFTNESGRDLVNIRFDSTYEEGSPEFMSALSEKISSRYSK